MSTNGSRAHLLSARLSAVVQQHYAEEAQQDSQEELERLRLEVIALKGEITMLRHELSSCKIVDIDGMSDEVVEVSAAVPQGDLDSTQIRSISFDSNAADVRLRFNCIAKNNSYIDVSMLVKHLAQNLSSPDKEKQVRAYESAVHKLEMKLSAPLSAKELKGATRRITFNTFRFLMTEDPDQVKEMFGIDVAKALGDIREALIDDVIVNEIAKACRVMESEVEAVKKQTDLKSRILSYLEFISAAATVLNALVIGLSLDFAPLWGGWFGIECGFTVFFLVELIANATAHGFADYLFGDDWHWNWFDIFIVCFGMTDTALAFFEKFQVVDNDAGIDMSVTRLFRLMKITRITRVTRLLRLRVFKELTLMMDGVVSSLRTIFWSVAVLFICIYVAGVFMRQIIDIENAVKCEKRLAGASGECSGSEYKMLTLGPVMFSSVARSMVFLFTCFTEGCSSPDGTPFIWLLWDTYGPFLVLLYLVAFVFINLGVLNLIAAMVVENTMATAVQHEAERLFGQQSHSDNVQKARDLHALLTRYSKVSADVANSKSAPRKGLRGKFDRYQKRKAREPEMQSGHLNLEISHDQFSEMLGDHEAIRLMEDLNISYISQKQLFAILDADGNGFLNVSEVVDGIMKLRGPPDKGDIVSMSLSVKQLQNHMNKLGDRIKGDPRFAIGQPALQM